MKGRFTGVVFIKDIDMKSSSNIKRSLVSRLKNMSVWSMFLFLLFLSFIIFLIQSVLPLSSSSHDLHRLAGEQLALNGPWQYSCLCSMSWSPGARECWNSEPQTGWIAS